ncbi:MAG: tRNA (adenosine(37)-N6)-threonylcarbamoyltransferase complex transferase subunit TsaD [Armatimonadota bacterium]|nr:tRNA (adenosine(37)-N6)-threonylcarbamoyltransferase complex transferase subunit TsaD [Armatimonadota bacterium]
MLVLGIETSCDETSAAVVEDKVFVRSNVVLSQTKLHEPFGGIVPEIASRKQMEFIAPVVKKAMEDAKVTWSDLDAIAVTNRPGLIGSLLVGVSFAKAIALAHNLPIIPINHLEGHVFSVFLRDMGESFEGHQLWDFPFLCLLVSGGHTELIWVKEVGDYEVLGRTKDDAAGEAFDKVARALGLGFLGGPAIVSERRRPKRNCFSEGRFDSNP